MAKSATQATLAEVRQPPMANQILEAGEGLSLHCGSDAALRIEWQDPDWLGAGQLRADSPALPADGKFEEWTHQPSRGADRLGAFTAAHWRSGVAPIAAAARAYRERALIVLQMSALQDLQGVANRSFARPLLAWHFAPAQRRPAGIAPGTRSFGYQYSEFALPVNGNADATGYFFAPHRPAVVEPLLFIAPDGRTLLLGPLDWFHEQIIAVPSDAEQVGHGVRCGWHGDLDSIPAGFTTHLALLGAASPRAALQAWGALLREAHQTQRLSRYCDELLGKLSYWTDNGAVYYYRTEPECDYTTTLERVVQDLQQRDIPIRSVQIDSWFYPHQNLRPVSAEGAPIVPPSGMMLWEPREDVFPEGLHGLRQRLDDLPLIFHSRHYSSASPYVQQFASWRDGEYAHPSEPSFYELLMSNAAGWGANTYEQDWLVEAFLGVRGLREAPGRARAWQEAMDHAAGENGLHLQWCMATPADFMQTVTLRNIASIRTSGDYRYLFDNGLNWVWFLHTNALARALGLWAFKDVFLSHGKTSLSDGEPYAEIEALLSALSAGPVAIGDQLGHTDRELVLRCCREDGVLIKPDAPLAALDRCFAENCFLAPSLLVGETYSAHPAGRWTYVASFNACQKKIPLKAEVRSDEITAPAPPRAAILYDWRRRSWELLPEHGVWRIDLDFQDWDYRIVCPLLEGDVTVFGDITKYASVGDQRISDIRCDGRQLKFTVRGAPHTTVRISGYSKLGCQSIAVWQSNGERLVSTVASEPEHWEWDAVSGGWCLSVVLDGLGYCRVTLTVR